MVINSCMLIYYTIHIYLKQELILKNTHQSLPLIVKYKDEIHDQANKRWLTLKLYNMYHWVSCISRYLVWDISLDKKFCS